MGSLVASRFRRLLPPGMVPEGHCGIPSTAVLTLTADPGVGLRIAKATAVDADPNVRGSCTGDLLGISHVDYCFPTPRLGFGPAEVDLVDGLSNSPHRRTIGRSQMLGHCYP
jgi:hypothetical protein